MSRLPALLGICALLVAVTAAPSLAHDRALDPAGPEPGTLSVATATATPAASPAPSSPGPVASARPSPTQSTPPAGAAAAPWPVPSASPGASSAPPTPRAMPRPLYGPWRLEAKITFYGPGGHYGRRTACGQTMTTKLVGVATYLYPCGTRIEFKYRGRTIVAPVVDRGPAAWTGFRFDLTGRACVNLVGSKGACWTIHNVSWRVVSTR